MTINVTRRAAVVGLSTCIALPVRAQTPSRSKDAADTYDTRAAGDLRDRCEHGQPEGNGAERPATGLAAERGRERRRLSSEQYFRRIPAQRKRGSSENDLLRQRFVSRLSHLRRGKIERQRSRQRRRVASLLEFRCFRQVRRQGPAAHPTTHDVPTDVAANVFTNVSSVEVAEPAEPNFPGVKVQRCS